MSEFPDDAACLEWLWRNRYSHRRGARPLPQVRGRADLQALRDVAAASVVDVHGVRPPPSPDRGDDLPQVVDVAAPVVLRHVPDDEHALRYLREAVGAGTWRHLQDGVAHGEPASATTSWRQDDDEPLSRRSRDGRNVHRRATRDASTAARPARSPRSRLATRRPCSAWSSAVAVSGPSRSRTSSKAMLMPHIKQRVLPASTIYTDEFAVVRRAHGSMGYQHHRDQPLGARST